MIFISHSALSCENGASFESRLHLFRPWVLSIPRLCLALGSVLFSNIETNLYLKLQTSMYPYLRVSERNKVIPDHNSESLNVTVSSGNPDTATGYKEAMPTKLDACCGWGASGLQFICWRGGDRNRGNRHL